MLDVVLWCDVTAVSEGRICKKATRKCVMLEISCSTWDRVLRLRLLLLITEGLIDCIRYYQLLNLPNVKIRSDAFCHQMES